MRIGKYYTKFNTEDCRNPLNRAGNPWDLVWLGEAGEALKEEAEEGDQIISIGGSSEQK